MKQALGLLVLSLAVSACQKQEANTAPTAKASDAVVRAYAALNAHDTNAYLNSLTNGARALYKYAPKQLAADLAYWNENHFDVQVLGESGDASEAVVTFQVDISGTHPERMTPSMYVVKENGEWKVSTTSLYSAADRVPMPVTARGGGGC